jgi:hypothetical protein
MKPSQHGMDVAYGRAVANVHDVAGRREAESQEVIVFEPHGHDRRAVRRRDRDAVSDDIPHHPRNARVADRGERLGAVDQHPR